MKKDRGDKESEEINQPGNRDGLDIVRRQARREGEKTPDPRDKRQTGKEVGLSAFPPLPENQRGQNCTSEKSE